MSFFSEKHVSSAKVVDGSLVLSLPDAVTPVVMRLGLDEVRSASFGVEETEETYTLHVQTGEKNKRAIAAFTSRDDAVNALMTTSAALEKGGNGVLRGSGASGGGSGAGKTGILKWIAALAVLILLIWLISMMSSGLPRPPKGGPGNVSAERPAFGADPNETGVPVTADEFLSRGQ